MGQSEFLKGVDAWYHYVFLLYAFEYEPSSPGELEWSPIFPMIVPVQKHQINGRDLVFKTKEEFVQKKPLSSFIYLKYAQFCFWETRI